eukprot:6031973-Pyramimonas_sp.AAC.1
MMPAVGRVVLKAGVPQLVCRLVCLARAARPFGLEQLSVHLPRGQRHGGGGHAVLNLCERRLAHSFRQRPRLLQRKDIRGR